MAVIFALDHLGAEFQVKLIDCTSGIVYDGDVAEQKIIFYKPDGVKFEKNATLVEDPDNPGQFYITYTNTDPEIISIFDLIGKWEYAGMVKLSDQDSFQTSQRAVFWVQ